MPMKPDELAELKTLIAAARKKPINFGICIGKKPDSMIFYLDRKKSPEILLRLAKKAGDTPKATMGTVSVSGKNMQLSLQGEMPSGLAKRLKVFLVGIKMPHKIAVFDAAGNALESDGESDEENSALLPQEDVKQASPPSNSTEHESESPESNPSRGESGSGGEALGAAGNDSSQAAHTAAAPSDSTDKKEKYESDRGIARKQVAVFKKLKVDVFDLNTDLEDAEKLVKYNDPPLYDDAIKKIADMDPKFAKASKDFCDQKKLELRAAIDLVKTYLGMELEVPKLEADYTTLETECGNDPVDFKKVNSIVRTVVREEVQLKKRSDKYIAEYDRIERRIYLLCDLSLQGLTDPMVAAERIALEDEVKVARKKLDENSSVLAEKLAVKTYFKIKALKDILAERTTYLTLKTTTETELARLYAVRNPGVEGACTQFEADEVNAKAFEDNRKYYDATLLMSPITLQISDLLQAATVYKLYETSSNQVLNGMISVQKNPQFEFVKPEFAELKANYRVAAALAKANDVGAAVNKMIDLRVTVNEIIKKADKAANLKDFENRIENGDVEKLHQQAKDILAELKNHPRVAIAPHLIIEIEKHVTELDTFWNRYVDYSARKELVIISDLANEARRKLDMVDAFYTRAERLEKATAALLKSHAQAPYIRPLLTKVVSLTRDSKVEALAGKDDVAPKLTEGEKWLALAKTTADNQVDYLVHRAALEPKIVKISEASFKFPEKPKVTTQITALMVQAEEASKAFKHEPAEKALTNADSNVMAAEIGSSANTGEPPLKKDIIKLLAQPDGQKTLDEMVATFPKKTQQDVMINVLEARFGMEVNVYKSVSKEDKDKAKTGKQLNVPAPNLMEYYEMLKSLPDSHTNLNPSLARFDQVEEDDASWYEPSNDKVVMTMDKDMNSKANKLGDPKELDDIDPDSVSKALPEEEEPTYGSWTTFHEVGHAVDDGQSFMDGKLGNIDFGGWVEYGKNVGPIAAAAAIHFEYDRNYIERIMAGGKPDRPEIPDELKANEGDAARKTWKERRKNFEKWYKAVSVGSKPWDSASAVNTHKIGDVMYHEAYGNSWVSYNANARKKGISGYQFRAPGEWFSELYAAFYTNKLSDSHPARPWLAAL